MEISFRTARTFEPGFWGNYVTWTDTVTEYVGSAEELVVLYPDHPYMIFRLVFFAGLRVRVCDKKYRTVRARMEPKNLMCGEFEEVV